jgi:hypothetical protein
MTFDDDVDQLLASHLNFFSHERKNSEAREAE